MEAFTALTAGAVPLDLPNIDFILNQAPYRGAVADAAHLLGTRRRPLRRVRRRVLRDDAARREDGERYELYDGELVEMTSPSFVGRDRAGILADRGIEGVPTLVIGGLSPSTAVRDRGMKKALYARHGLPYLWLLDPGDEFLEAYELRADGHVLAGRHAGRAVASLPPFADLAFALRDLWG